MACLGYRFAVEHIALNDDPSVMDEEQIVGTLTVGLVADLFEKTAEEVARSVYLARKRIAKEERNK